MPASVDGSFRSSRSQNEESDVPLIPRRIRHITGIQIRNLTPFPARDAFASALKKPAEQSQFTAHGHLSDDLDLTIGRKHGRRFSNSSVATFNSLKNEPESPSESGGRRRTLSKASASSGISGGSSTPSLGRRGSVSGGPPVSRPSHRLRTTSSTSRHGLGISGIFGEESSSTFSSATGLLRDTSQNALVKVLQSRLVETFITLSLPPSDEVRRSNSTRSTMPSKPRKDKSTLSPSQDSTTSRRGTVGAASPAALLNGFIRSHNRTISSPANGRTGRDSLSPSPSRSISPAPPSTFPSSRHEHHATVDTASSSGSAATEAAAPDYLSPIHCPSTNPSFQLDPRSGFEFAPGADLTASSLRLEVWGRVGDGNWASPYSNGKGKEKEVGDQPEWKVLEGWDLDLNQLKQLPSELAAHPSHLPSNTLVVTLNPPGQTFYLSAPALQKRSPSPFASSGYSSDPESEMRSIASAGDLFTAGDPARQLAEKHLEERKPARRKRGAKSAGWQDLLKLINLQKSIADMQQSLQDVEHDIDRMVTDRLSYAVREISQRTAWVSQLQEERESVSRASDDLRSRIDGRKEALRMRRELLSLARGSHESDAKAQAELGQAIAEERAELSSLRSNLAPIRSVLITTLADIFPIELLSPPDLLFTVLGVPLPIPLGATDPGPPLGLAGHREVTEDAVATALGYAAQVVQLLAAYMGVGLVYPVTCVGSKSLIKDGISAMVGPRMFPLFSKGVDTYRFEYGVFLLNKDIEMLMSERNLRALDMRHTLPNLKNLLLTLTDSETAIPSRFTTASSSASISSLRSPVLTPSTLPSEAASGSRSEAQAEGLPSLDSTLARSAATERDSPPASGASTPTADATATPRKSRAFLDLAPLTGFLRGRYPSTSARPAPKAAQEPEDGSANGDAQGPEADADDEDDRRTIRGTPTPVDGQPEELDAEVKVEAANGHGNGHARRGSEKGDGADALATALEVR